MNRYTKILNEKLQIKSSDMFLKKKNMCWKYQIFAKDLTYPLMHSIHYEADVNVSPVLSLFDKNTDAEWLNSLFEQTG